MSELLAEYEQVCCRLITFRQVEFFDKLGKVEVPLDPYICLRYTYNKSIWFFSCCCVVCTYCQTLGERFQEFTDRL